MILVCVWLIYIYWVTNEQQSVNRLTRNIPHTECAWSFPIAFRCHTSLLPTKHWQLLPSPLENRNGLFWLKAQLMLSHFKFWGWYCVKKGSRENSCPSVRRIPGGVWAHLGDQESAWISSWGGGSLQLLGQWGVEVGATSALGIETANPVSCPVSLSSRSSIPSFRFYQALWASTENVDRGSCTSRQCRLLGWSSSIPATLCRGGTNDCDLSWLRRRFLLESSHILI